MKRLIALLLALLVPCCVALGEATLSFSSFSGGGYEYTVELDDPSIASCETRYEFEEQGEPVSGVTYDFTATFTGLKPGSTTARVYGRSPTMRNDDRIYTVAVDDALNVALAPVRTISTFFLSRMIEGGFASFQITMDANGYRVSVDEGEEQPFDAGAIDELMSAIDTYDVASWNGFQEYAAEVLDGEEFWLEIGFTDGTSVVARGDNAFPDNYSDAMAEIWRILTWNTEKRS